MSRAARLALLAHACGCVLAAGCGDHEFEPPDRDAQVAAAEASYESASFDTVQWPDSATRLREGNAVFAAHCRKCHGPLGQAGTDYAAAQGLAVPSLVRADWPYATVDDVRRRVHAGHPDGMPTWSVARLTPREIDAVSAYVLEGLRVERGSSP